MNRVVYLGGAMSCYFNTEQADYPKQWRKEAKEYANKLYEGMTLIAPTDFYGIGENYNKTEAEAMRNSLCTFYRIFFSVKSYCNKTIWLIKQLSSQPMARAY